MMAKRDPRNKLPHPMQPIEWDAKYGAVRFKQNGIVDALLEFAQARGFGLNEICRAVAEGQYRCEDYEQLMQLIGYSVSGFGSLNVRRALVRTADAIADAIPVPLVVQRRWGRQRREAAKRTKR